MKIYISADIEGIAGIAHWDEADHNHAAWGQVRDRMTEHVAAACEGALAAGATEVWVKDAHGPGRNIDPAALPGNTRLIRGWSDHPLMMVQEIDESFDALGFVGYHSRAGSGGNPMAHTLSASKIMGIRIDGEPVSEYHLYARAAGAVGVPSVFLSGDEGICAAATAMNPAVTVVPSLYGVGESTVSRHPNAVRDEIRSGMEAALRGDLARCLLPVEGPHVLEIEFHKAGRAYRASQYPGATLIDDHTVRVSAERHLDVLRALVFIV